MSETFYGRFYRFESAPFHITPDPSLLFATQTHEQALGVIEYGIVAGKGFIVITGEVGVGKTTILRYCLDRLDPHKSKIIYVFNPSLTVADLYTTILEGLDVPAPEDRDPLRTVQMLQQALLDTNKRGIQVILAVDEAQNMPEATLESLRVLSNLETAQSKLLQIVLVGQSELEATLRKHGLRQLAQRVAVRARIAPLTVRQSVRYVQHRLRCAGRADEPPLFARPALLYLALVSRGIPRTLNICCDNALINGYGHGAERITLRIAWEAVRPLRLKWPLGGRSVFWLAGAVILIAFAVGVVVLDGGLNRQGGTPLARWAGTVEPSAGNRFQPSPETPSTPTAVARAPAESKPTPLGSVAASGSLAVVATAPQAGVPPPDSATEPERDKVAVALESPSTPTPDPGNPRADVPVKKWVVRKGDTVIKACRAAYGSCEKKTMLRLLRYNPQLDEKRGIKPGDVIFLPGKTAAVRSRPN